MRLALSACLVLALAVSNTVFADEPLPSTSAEAKSADGPADAPDSLQQLDATLDYKSGDVVVGDNLATLHLGTAMRYLGPQDAEKVLVAWGNPPGSESLGMLVPGSMSPLEEDAWAVIVTYSGDGHVDDEDAKDTDFDELLGDMKKDTEEANEERTKAGFDAVHLVGWAEPPHYDAKTRKLYWAKRLDFGGPNHTLNYDIRVLGREGVLELNAVASMDQLEVVKAEMPKVLNAVEFNTGHRYTDFDPKMDKLAAYGIGALVAGKLAAKVGLFKVIIVALLASKKLLIAGGVAIAVFVKKLLSKKAAETPPESPSV